MATANQLIFGLLQYRAPSDWIVWYDSTLAISPRPSVSISSRKSQLTAKTSYTRTPHPVLELAISTQPLFSKNAPYNRTTYIHYPSSMASIDYTSKQMTKCKYHHMGIVSFCLNVGCLLPLCSQCIPQHQAYHFETSTQMCIVKLQQSIEAAQVQLSSMLTPLVKLRSEFHETRSRKLEMFYENIQRQKSLLLARVEEQFNSMTSNYVQFIEHGLVATRQKLQNVINEIERDSLGLMSGSRTIETLVQFWINRRAIKEKIRVIQKDTNLHSNRSNPESLESSFIKNIENDADKIFRTTKALFIDVPTAVTESQNRYQNSSAIGEDKVADRISILQEQNKRILHELGKSRSFR